MKLQRESLTLSRTCSLYYMHLYFCGIQSYSWQNPFRSSANIQIVEQMNSMPVDVYSWNKETRGGGGGGYTGQFAEGQFADFLRGILPSVSLPTENLWLHSALRATVSADLCVCVCVRVCVCVCACVLARVCVCV